MAMCHSGVAILPRPTINLDAAAIVTQSSDIGLCGGRASDLPTWQIGVVRARDEIFIQRLIEDRNGLLRLRVDVTILGDNEGSKRIRIDKTQLAHGRVLGE